MSFTAQLIFNYNMWFLRMVSYVMAAYCLMATWPPLLRKNRKD